MSDVVLDFIRHGEPVGGRRYRGHGVDDPLSDLGWKQMRDCLSDVTGWDHVVSSPMKRCSEFAEEVANRLNIDISLEPRLREVGFGSWEGKTPQELKTERPDEFEAFYQNPVENRPQGAESLEVFGQRVADAMNHIVDIHRGKSVLVIAHAGVIRAALGHALKIDPAIWYRAKVNNAAVTRLSHSNNHWHLEYHNRLSLNN